MRNIRIRSMTTLAAAIALCSVAAQAQDFDLTWHTIDGGGAMFTTAGAFELSGTIGQPDAGTVTAGPFTLSGGFWPGAGGAPVAKGACCLPDGSCENGLTEQECADKEGVEWHEGKPCNQVECPPARCNGNETISKAKCKTKRGAVKKLIVKIKKGTPFMEYTAKLNTGQTVDKNTNKKGKATFKFTRGNKPGCGNNGVTVSTGGGDCVSKDFDCNC